MEENIYQKRPESMRNEQQKESHKGISMKRFVPALCWGLLIMAAFLAVQFIIVIPFAVVILVRCINESENMTQAMQLYQQAFTNQDLTSWLVLATNLTIAIVAVIWYRIRDVGHWGIQKLRQTVVSITRLQTVIRIVGYGFFSYCVANILAQLVAVVSPSAMEILEQTMNLAMGDMNVFVVLELVLIAPIGEECIFRGLIFNSLKKRIPISAAIILQAVLFGLYHMNFVQGIYVIPLAILCAYAVYKTGSVMAGVLIHAINNGLSVVASLLPEQFLKDSYFVILLALSSVVCIIFFCMDMRNKRVEKAQEEREAYHESV